MGEAIGQSLPLAIGVALSPVPIIAVVLMLTTPRARANGPAFVLGWLVGLGWSAPSCWRSPDRAAPARKASRRPG
jgi:Sap, sulfolipid-1-addressing protein